MIVNASPRIFERVIVTFAPGDMVEQLIVFESITVPAAGEHDPVYGVSVTGARVSPGAPTGTPVVAALGQALVTGTVVDVGGTVPVVRGTVVLVVVAGTVVVVTADVVVDGGMVVVVDDDVVVVRTDVVVVDDDAVDVDVVPPEVVVVVGSVPQSRAPFLHARSWRSWMSVARSAGGAAGAWSEVSAFEPRAPIPRDTTVAIPAARVASPFRDNCEVRRIARVYTVT